MTCRTLVALLIAMPTVVHNRIYASVVEFTDAAAWQTAVRGNFTTIDFTGFPHDTFITDQYKGQEITFTGVNLITGPTPLFQNDQWGLFSPDGAHVTFSAPQNWIAVNYSGAIMLNLYNAGDLIYTSSFFQPGGVGNFTGLISSVSFDEVYLFRPAPHLNQIFIDDLHFGAIPAPGALGVFAIGLLGTLSRHRRREN